jgi:hypothetical protein
MKPIRTLSIDWSQKLFSRAESTNRPGKPSSRTDLSVHHPIKSQSPSRPASRSPVRPGQSNLAKPLAPPLRGPAPVAASNAVQRQSSGSAPRSPYFPSSTSLLRLHIPGPSQFWSTTLQPMKKTNNKRQEKLKKAKEGKEKKKLKNAARLERTVRYSGASNRQRDQQIDTIRTARDSGERIESPGVHAGRKKGARGDGVRGEKSAGQIKGLKAKQRVVSIGQSVIGTVQELQRDYDLGGNLPRQLPPKGQPFSLGLYSWKILNTKTALGRTEISLKREA